MRNLLVIGLLLVSIFFFQPAQAQPPLWQDDFGDELTDLTGCDDCTQMVNLPFSFPFNGTNYNMAYVGTNGGIQLGEEGSNGVDYDYWIYMEEFLSDDGQPLLLPIEADWDLSDDNDGIGMVYYNNTGNPLIFTWHDVGTNENTDTTSTFQLLIYQDGTIVSNLNGILDGPGENLIDDLDTGIIVGITPSDFPYDGEPIVPGDPGPVDLNQGPFNSGSTTYERWCFEEANSCGTDDTNTGLPGPINTAFDLDYQSVCFVPNGQGFYITSGGEGNLNFTCGAFIANVPTLSEWGLIAMAGVLGIIGLLAIRRRKIAS